MTDSEYTKKLESVIRQMLTPLKSLPFPLVVEGISNHKVLPFNSNDSKDLKVLETLKSVAVHAGRKINENGILRSRPNEVGNDIEAFVKSSMNEIGYKAETPKTRGGKRKTTGYPDLRFIDEFGRAHYLECKTFNIENIDTTQRSFYLSPSDDFKVTEDALHFVMSFEILEKTRKGSQNLYHCRTWKILTLDKLYVDVKYEFNSDNARLYDEDLILAEGDVV